MRGRPSGYAHSGMTPNESAVMDLWDSGQSLAAIATAVYLSISTIRGIVSQCAYSEHAQNQLDENIRAASARLGAACAAYQARRR